MVAFLSVEKLARAKFNLPKWPKAQQAKIWKADTAQSLDYFTQSY